VSEVVGDDQLDAAAQSYLDDMLAASSVGLKMPKQDLNVAVDDRFNS
jgi:1,4-dihydroxy-2-naphthoyl-CoA synthase